MSATTAITQNVGTLGKVHEIHQKRFRESSSSGRMRSDERRFRTGTLHERNHQGRENRIIQPQLPDELKLGTVDCKQRLGGILRYYHRAAA